MQFSGRSAWFFVGGVKRKMMLLAFLLSTLTGLFAQQFALEANEAFDGSKVLSPVLSDSVADRLISAQPSFAEWSSFFHIKPMGNFQTVLGDYRVEENRISFTPRYRPDTDQKYSLVFNRNILAAFLKTTKLSTIDSLVTEALSFGESGNRLTELEAVYPAVNIIPANAKRIYLYFSGPMGDEAPGKFVSFGTTIQDASRLDSIESSFEWDSSRTVLAIKFDSASLNDPRNSILVKDRLYELRVNGAWKNAQGIELGKDQAKKFFALAPKFKKLRKRSLSVESDCQQECVLIVSFAYADPEMLPEMLFIQSP
ncbi:MAG: hypothetical protein AAF616_13770, partial [Bacteroidota bacterium]